jgi:hypothetical protein
LLIYNNKIIINSNKLTASDEKSSAGITCCYLLLAVVSENGQTGGSVLPVVTPCLLSSTSQFTSQLEIFQTKKKHLAMR